MTVTADLDVLRNDLYDLLREYETRPYGDLRLNAERAVAKVLTAIAEHPVLEIRPYYPTQDAYDATCAALEKHRQRAVEAEARLAELEHALTWHTTCLACSRVLDSSYAETMRREKAEASIVRVHEVHYSITRDGKQWCNACSSITGHHYMPYPCPTIRALGEPAQQEVTDGR